jgi:hypothetical protein
MRPPSARTATVGNWRSFRSIAGIRIPPTTNRPSGDSRAKPAYVPFDSTENPLCSNLPLRSMTPQQRIRTGRSSVNGKVAGAEPRTVQDLGFLSGPASAAGTRTTSVRIATTKTARKRQIMRLIFAAARRTPVQPGAARSAFLKPDVPLGLLLCGAANHWDRPALRVVVTSSLSLRVLPVAVARRFHQRRTRYANSSGDWARQRGVSWRGAARARVRSDGLEAVILRKNLERYVDRHMPMGIGAGELSFASSLLPMLNWRRRNNLARMLHVQDLLNGVRCLDLLNGVRCLRRNRTHSYTMKKADAVNLSNPRCSTPPPPGSST